MREMTMIIFEKIRQDVRSFPKIGEIDAGPLILLPS